MRIGQGAVPAIFPHDGKGLAPVALPRKEPVAQLEIDRLAGQAAAGELADDLRLGVRRGQAVERTGMNGVTFADKGLERLRFARARTSAQPQRGRGGDHGANRQRVLPGKFPIAFIVRRHRHDRARAVANQHVIGDPDGMRSTFTGLMAKAPVQMPVLSFANSVRSRSLLRAVFSRYSSTARACSSVTSRSTSGCSGPAPCKWRRTRYRAAW